MQRTFIALPILLPLVLLTVSGCPKEPATEPSLPKEVQGKPGGPGQTPLTLPAWASALNRAIVEDMPSIVRGTAAASSPRWIGTGVSRSIAAMSGPRTSRARRPRSRMVMARRPWGRGMMSVVPAGNPR